MKRDYNELFNCPVTLSDDHITYLDFGLMPLANNLTDTKDESLNCPKYPLAINYYPESKLSMLSVAVDPKILFSHYVYKSGTNKPYIEHCNEMFDYLQKFVKRKLNDIIIDIGGNDGTLLCAFRDRALAKHPRSELRLFNVDPSENLARISRDRGILTVNKLWSSDVAMEFSEDPDYKAKIITSTNVFQHTQPIANFVSGIYHALRDDGVWCLEFPYWKHDLETNQYDQTYHEHIYYYLLTPLFKLFTDRGMDIIDVSEHKIHGGTLRVISRKHQDDYVVPLSVTNILEEEKKFDDTFYKNWGEHMKVHLVNSKTFLTDLKKLNKKIVGFGAAAKGCTFLNAAEVNHEIIDYIVDDTDTKQNKFMPGVGIPIVNRQHLIDNPPDYIVILAHNFADYIRESLKSIYKGKFIVMFPRPVIYE